jgi:hypothetical protein
MKFTTYLRSSPKERDSLKAHRTRCHTVTEGALTLTRALFQETYTEDIAGRTSQDYNSTTSRRFSS